MAAFQHGTHAGNDMALAFDLRKQVRFKDGEIFNESGSINRLVGGWDCLLLSHWRTRVVNIHIEDMVCGVHEHLMFGQGTMDFPSICQSLHRIGYAKGVHVELSRHSHMGVEGVGAAMQFLGPLIGSGTRLTISRLD